MGTTLIDNFAYKGKRFLDSRQGVATIAELKAVPETSIPDGFRAYCAEDGQWYQYGVENTVDATTGKWRKITTEVTQEITEATDTPPSNKAVSDYVAGKVDPVLGIHRFKDIKAQQSTTINHSSSLINVMLKADETIILSIDDSEACLNENGLIYIMLKSIEGVTNSPDSFIGRQKTYKLPCDISGIGVLIYDKDVIKSGAIRFKIDRPGEIDNIKDDIGELNDLKTENKSNMVSAINELSESGGTAEKTSFDDSLLNSGSDNVQDVIDAIFAGYDKSVHKEYSTMTTPSEAVGSTNGTFGLFPGQIVAGDTITVLCTADSVNTISSYGFLRIKYKGAQAFTATSPINVNVPIAVTMNKDVEDIFVEFPASAVTGSGNLSMSLAMDKKKDPVVTEMIEQTIEKYPIMKDGQSVIDFCDTFGLSEFIAAGNGVPSIVIGGDNTLGRYERNIWNYISYIPNIFEISDAFLKSCSLLLIDGMGSVVDKDQKLSFIKYIYESDGDIFQTIRDNKGKYIRAEVFVYSAHEDFPQVGSANTIYTNSAKIRLNLTSVEDTESEYVKKLVFGPSLINVGDEFNNKGYIYFSISATASTQYSPGEYGFTGWKIGIFDTKEDADTINIIGDWQLKSVPVPVTSNKIYSPDFYSKVVDFSHCGVTGANFNKVADAYKILKLFKNRYDNKYVDKFNRLVVSFNGDSIIGSQLDDIAHVDGYDSGEFPPNMSKMIMARQFFDRYRFKDEDVEFRNLIHSDWTRVGFDISNGKDDKTQTFNEIEVYGCSEGDSAQISVAGKQFIKFIWSEYKGLPYSFDIMSSDDGGVTFTKKRSVNVSSERALMVAYEIMEIDPSKEYTFKIVPTSGYSDICFWGVETWTVPRLDVVVEAYSGSTAAGNIQNKLDGFYSDMHKPALIIMDIFAINDYSVSHDIDKWLDAINQLYDFIDGHKIPVISFSTHYGNDFVKMSCDVLDSRGNFAINILKKISSPKTAPIKPITNSTDGLHLSDYGNQYFFEELKRIFDGFITE